MSILWNGEKTDSFNPSQGLRQRNPLSPYLFVLCLERLCHMIGRSIAAKEWKPICLLRGRPRLSHIYFADDLILFYEALVSQVWVIRRVLEKFCVASGQKVSLQKSFSNNVSRDLGKLISEEGGIKAQRSWENTWKCLLYKSGLTKKLLVKYLRVSLYDLRVGRVVL